MALRGTLHSPSRGFSLFANLYLAGTIIFGGGPVVIPLLREYVVNEGWESPRDFLFGLATIQAFPGPNFNFAVYLGTLAVAGSGTNAAVGALVGYIAIFAPGLTLHVNRRQALVT
jgi:chromate transport protein ChrA